MNKHEAVIFLFTIAKEVERFFESPAILFTQYDYAGNVYKALVDLRAALFEESPPKRVANIVNEFHIDWLQAIADIEKFANRVRAVPRDTIIKAIHYTIETTHNRYKCFLNYITQFEPVMTEEEKALMESHVSTITDRRENVHGSLLDKEKYLLSQADKREYYDLINDEIEECMIWVDRLYDNLAIQVCKVVDTQITLEPTHLMEMLQQIITEVSRESDPETQKIAKVLENPSKRPKLICATRNYDLEMYTVAKEIKKLEYRMSRLARKQSPALMALLHKSTYLKEKLASLENTKTSLCRLKAMRREKENKCVGENEIQIFNHLLPHHGRRRLVEELLTLWNNALGEKQCQQPIISILNAADLKEIFRDDMGQYTMDKHGRKIYTKEGDNQLYQLNENQKLVALQDNGKHVYFYDECGRYYLGYKGQRIYKAHEAASEYALNVDGDLIKIKEQKDGIDYYYDNLGRYYMDNGRRVYRQVNCDSEYERDDLGNLIRIRACPNYEISPIEPGFMLECVYLKQEVGQALRSCIAEVILYQPNDPIEYLASSLEKYRRNIVERQVSHAEHKELIVERQLRQMQEQKPKAPEQSYVYEESLDNYSYEFIQDEG